MREVRLDAGLQQFDLAWRENRTQHHGTIRLEGLDLRIGRVSVRHHEGDALGPPLQ